MHKNYNNKRKCRKMPYVVVFLHSSSASPVITTTDDKTPPTIAPIDDGFSALSAPPTSSATSV